MTWKLVLSLLLLRGSAVVVNTQVCSDMQEMKCNQTEKFSQCEFLSSHLHYNVTLAVTDEATRNLRHATEENCYIITCSGAPVFSSNIPTANCSIIEYSCNNPPDIGTCQECPKDVAGGAAIGIAAFLGFIVLFAVVVIVLLVLEVKELQKQSAIKSGLPNPCGSVLRSLQKIRTNCCYSVEDHCSCLMLNRATRGVSNADSQPSAHQYINTEMHTRPTIYRKPPNIPKPQKENSKPLRNVRRSSPLKYERPESPYEDMT